MPRPKGLPKTGGRKKGVPNKRTAELVANVAQEGLTPLEVMLQAMRRWWDAGEPEKAVDCAAKAAPYLHARLASTEVSGKGGGPVEHIAHIVTGVPRPEDKTGA